MTRPSVRHSFRKLVVDMAVKENRPVRYVSIGSGGLLMDFEIIIGLLDKGLTILSVTVIDQSYGPIRDRLDANREQADNPRSFASATTTIALLLRDGVVGGSVDDCRKGDSTCLVDTCSCCPGRFIAEAAGGLAVGVAVDGGLAKKRGKNSS